MSFTEKESWNFHYGNETVGNCHNCNCIIKKPNDGITTFSRFITAHMMCDKNNNTHYWTCNQSNCKQIDSTTFMYVDHIDGSDKGEDRCIGIYNNGNFCNKFVKNNNKLCDLHRRQFIASYNI